MTVRSLVPLVLFAVAAGVAVFVLHQRGEATPRRYPSAVVPPATWQEPRPGVVQPEEFGAVGDGVHDDGPALQAAITAAEGRIVELSGGRTYLSRNSLDLPSHTTLRGPSDAVLSFTWQHSADPDSGGPFYLGNLDQGTGNDDIVLEGFAIRGAADGLPAGPMTADSDPNVPAIRLRLVNSFSIRNLDVGFAPGISVLYQGSVHGVIADNYVHDSGRDGITGTSLQTVLADIEVSGNLIERVGDDAIAVAGATVRAPNSEVLPTDIRITGNQVNGWEQNPNGEVLGRGVALLAVTDVTVSDNQIRRTAAAGILLLGAPSDDSVNPLNGKPWVSSHVTITGNIIEDAAALGLDSTLTGGFGGENGIDVADSEFVVARDNEVDAAVGDDLVVHDCDHCDIQTGSS